MAELLELPEADQQKQETSPIPELVVGNDVEDDRVVDVDGQEEEEEARPPTQIVVKFAKWEQKVGKIPTKVTRNSPGYDLYSTTAVLLQKRGGKRGDGMGGNNK